MAMPRLRIPVCLETGVRFALQRRLTESLNSPPNNWSRPVVRAVRPQVDCGRRPAKTTVGEYLTVEADAFVDGHESLVCDVRARHATSGKWTSHRMQPLLDDRWRGSFPVTETGLHRFTVRARIDEFATWRDDLKQRSSAGHDLTVELQVGAGIVGSAAARARAGQRRMLELLAESLRGSRRGLHQPVPLELATWASGISDSETLAGVLFGDVLGSVMGDLADPDTGTTSEVYGAFADVAKARFSILV